MTPPLAVKHPDLALTALLLLAHPCAAQDVAPPAPTAWSLTGTVVDAAGVPVEGAGMVFGAWREVLTDDALLRPRARSGADGRFRIELEEGDVVGRVPTQYGLLIAAPGRAAVAVYVHALTLRRLNPAAAPGPVELGRIVLPPGVDLFGRVRDPAGTALAGVVVTTRDVLVDRGFGLGFETTELLSSTRTGEDGIFRLKGVPTWGLRVQLRLDGYYRKTIVPVAHGTPLQVELRPSGFVSGRVLGPDGGPVATDVTVEYQAVGQVPGNTWHALPTLVRAAPDGTFRLGVELPGPYRVSALAPPGLAVYSVASEWNHKPGAEVELRLQHPKGRPGLLVEALARRTGEAVGDVHAGVLWDGFPGHDLSYLPLILAFFGDRGTGGSVLVPGPGPEEAEVGALFVDSPGFAPAFQIVRWTGPRDESRERPRRYRISLEDPCRVKGRVTEAGNAPVAGVVVWATPHSDSFVDSHVDLAWRRIRSTTTDADGTYELEGLGPGAWTVRAQVPGRPASAARELELHREDVVEDHDLELPAARTVEVSLPGLTTLPGARLDIRMGSDEDLSSRELFADARFPCEVAVDAEGRALVPGLAAGRWSLRLLVPRLEGRLAPLAFALPHLEVDADAERITVDTADSRPGTVTGKLRLEGAPVPRHRLLVVAEPAEAAGMIWGAFEPLAVPVSPLAPDGSYELAVPPGDVRLYLLDLATNAPVAAGDTFSVDPGARVRRDLTAALTELTVVVDPDRGDAWPDHVELRVHIEGGPDQDTLPDLYSVGAGRSVAEGEREVAVLVPLGRATVFLRARQPATGWGRSPLFEILDQQEVEIDELAPTRVTLRAVSRR